MENDDKSLSYRLASGIRYVKKGSALYLIRENPLATLVLNPAWASVLNVLSSGEFIPFKEICRHVSADADEIEIYLNSIVRKGFMDSTGYRYPETCPFISIIIPVRNRPDDIARCLSSLLKLDYPHDKKEIIVVDDASDDNTPEVIAGFPVKLIKNSERMQASRARNLAAKEAKGELLAFIDSDCTADPLWLKELISAFNDEANGAAGGKVGSGSDKRALDRYEKISSSLNMGNRAKSSREEGNFFYVPACNLLVRKKIFFKLKGFNGDMTVGEDVDFCWRLRDIGYDIEYRPRGTVYHRHRNETAAFIKRRFQYGTSEPLLQKIHPDRVKRMFYVPPAAVQWSIMLLAVITGQYYLTCLCAVVLFIDTGAKWKQAKQKNLPIKYIQIMRAAFRGYFVSLYFWCAFFSRYYLFAALLFLPLFPLLCLVLFINHFIVVICEFFLKKTEINIFAFTCFFSMDQLAYQAGVWYGCFRYLSFNPVNPKISRWKT